MKNWQHGYDLDFLKETASKFQKYNDLCISPFLRVKKNNVAEHLKNEALILKKGFRCVLKKTKVKTNIKVYSSRPMVLAYKDVGELEISKLVIEDLDSFKSYCDDLDYNIWVITFDNEEKNLLSCGFKKIGYKYTSFGDDLGVFYMQKHLNFLGTDEDRLLFTDPLERSTCVDLSVQIDVDGIAKKIEDYDFKKHYSNYNKLGGWSALSLRGFNEDPSFICKPSEMDKKWKQKHKDDVFFLTDTKAYDDFDEIRNIISEFAPTQKIERVRIMKLSKGSEIGKHTDLVDSDCGVILGKVARFHVPLITDGAVFEVWGQEGKESFNLKKGSLWYLDVRKPHRVTNPNCDRFHLVFDVFVDDEIRNKILDRI